MNSPDNVHACGRILLLASLPPLPARANGFSIRYAPILAELAASHELDLALVQDTPRESVDVAVLESVFGHVGVYERRHRRQPLFRRLASRIMTLVPGSKPYPLVMYDASDIETFLLQTFGRTEYDVLIVTSPELIDECRRVLRATRVVIDAIDSLTLLAVRKGKHNWIDRIDRARMRRWERKLHSKADFVSYISHNDRDAVYGNTSVPANVGVIPNGVYLDDFDSGSMTSTVSATPARDGRGAIVFLGNMGYGPNIEAAQRLATLLPRVRARWPMASLSIVGRSPSPEIQSLAASPGVTVTGTVPSIWPYLRQADACCFPMVSGAGLQNKVLEAMWSGVPVVTSSVGNNGVQGVHLEHLMVADDDDATVDALVYLLGRPEEARRLGEAGRAFVRENFSWSRVLGLVRREFLGDARAVSNGAASLSAHPTQV